LLVLLGRDRAGSMRAKARCIFRIGDRMWRATVRLQVKIGGPTDAEAQGTAEPGSRMPGGLNMKVRRQSSPRCSRLKPSDAWRKKSPFVARFACGQQADLQTTSTVDGRLAGCGGVGLRAPGADP